MDKKLRPCAEYERLKELLTDTITLLCKNGLKYKQEFSVDALIGITLDKQEVLLVNIKEIFQSALTSQNECSDIEQENTTSPESHISDKDGSPNKRKQKRPSHNSTFTIDGTPPKQSRFEQDNSSKVTKDINGHHEFNESLDSNDFSVDSFIKQEQSLDAGDVVVVKQELGSFQSEHCLSTVETVPPFYPPGSIDAPTSTNTRHYPIGLSQGTSVSSKNESQFSADMTLNNVQLNPTNDPSKQMFLPRYPFTNVSLGAADEAYPCQYCDRKFSLRHNLTRHIKGVHKMGQTYNCPCGASFHWATTFKKHWTRCLVASSSTSPGETDVSQTLVPSSTGTKGKTLSEKSGPTHKTLPLDSIDETVAQKVESIFRRVEQTTPVANEKKKTDDVTAMKEETNETETMGNREDKYPLTSLDAIKNTVNKIA